MDCLFCKVLSGAIPSTKVFENENVYAFRDIKPLAKEHILFIHKKHSKDLTEMEPQHISEVMAVISIYIKDNSSFSRGARIVTNIGPHAGQTVFHTHFHLLGGEQLRGFGA